MTKFFKKIFNRTKRADKIAECRMKYFDKIIEYYSHDDDNRWSHLSLEEAMKEANSIATWIYQDSDD